MRIEKTNMLDDGRQLFAYWANNAGRGSDNCTLVLVPNGVVRPEYSRQIPANAVIAITRTSSWRGKVNLSRAVCERLGISKDDIVQTPTPTYRLVDGQYKLVDV